MLGLSWHTFRDRWQVFVGAIVTVCLGVALVQSSLLALVSAATARVPADLPPAEQRALRDGYGAAATLLGMTLGLAAFVAIFIVSSTFAFTVAQRRRDLALLRLTGASRGQVRRLLLGEALLLGVVGSTLGVLAGLPLMRLQTWILVRFGFVPPGFAGQWRSWLIAVAIGTGVCVALCGVLAASGRAARVRPLEALRDVGAARRVMTVGRWVVGLLFLADAVAMLVLVPTVQNDGAAAISIFISMILVVAFAALAPLIVPLVSWPLRLVARGRIGHLVQANVRTGVRRSASTAAPIMVLIGFVGGLAGTMSTIGEAGRQELIRTLQADLVLSTERSVTDELTRVDGVAAASEEIPIDIDVRVDDGDGGVSYEEENALAVDPAAYQRMHRLDPVAGDLADLRGDDTIAVDVADLPDVGARLGGTVWLRFGEQERQLRVVALLPSTIVGAPLLLPTGAAPDPAAPRRYVVQVVPDADPNVVAGRLAGLGAVTTAAQWIQSTADEQQRQSIDVLLALLGMAMTYTVVAMVNAVVLAAADRRAEFATARVSGLTRGQVVAMALAESVAVIVIGLFLGGLAAAATVLGISTAIDNMTGIHVMVVPWPPLGTVALGATVLVGATSALTSLAATRTPAIRLVGGRE